MNSKPGRSMACYPSKRASRALYLLCLFILACKPRVDHSSLQGTWPKLTTPPKVAYHFGAYEALHAYGVHDGPPTEDAWKLIPSVSSPPGGPYRSGFFVGQHPAFNERYAAESGIDGAPWMLTVYLEDDCIYNKSRWYDFTAQGLGPECPPEMFRRGATNAAACLEKANVHIKGNGVGVVQDSWWPEAGFWYLADRTCVRSFDATADGFLQAAVSVPDFWGMAPFTNDERRDKDADNLPGEISFAVLVRAFSESALGDKQLLKDLALGARKSDIEALKEPLAVVTEYALACAEARQLPALKRVLSGFLGKVGATGSNPDADGPKDSRASEKAEDSDNAGNTREPSIASEKTEQSGDATRTTSASIARQIDDLARRGLPGLKSVCPGVKSQVGELPRAPVTIQSTGAQPAEVALNPASPEQRIACTKYFVSRGIAGGTAKDACVGQSNEGIECVKFFNARGNALPESAEACIALNSDQIGCLKFHKERGNSLAVARSGCNGMEKVGIDCAKFFTARGNAVGDSGAACSGLNAGQIECVKYFNARGNALPKSRYGCDGMTPGGIDCVKHFTARGAAIDTSARACLDMSPEQISCVKHFEARGNPLALAGQTCTGLLAAEIACVKSANASGKSLTDARAMCH